MKVQLSRVPHSANQHEVILAINKLVDELNTVLENIDEENISDALLERIGKEDKK